MTAFICNTQKGKWDSTVNKDKTLCLLFTSLPHRLRHTPCRVSNSLFLTWTWWMYIYINNRSSPKCEGLLWRMFPSKDVLHSKQSQSEPSRGGYFECETQNCSFSNSGQDCIKTLEASSPLLFYVQWSFLSSVGGYVPSAHECLKPWMIPNPLCVVSLQRHTCDNLIN